MANGTINKQSAISIGVVVIIIGAVVWIVSVTTNTSAKVDNMAGVVSTLDEKFIPRGELDQRLLNIEGGVERNGDGIQEIKAYIIK